MPQPQVKSARSISSPTARIDGSVLVIELPISGPRPSGSGKTLVIASTGGNLAIQGLEYDGKQVKIGVNAFIPKD